MQNKMDLRKKK